MFVVIKTTKHRLSPVEVTEGKAGRSIVVCDEKRKMSLLFNVIGSTVLRNEHTSRTMSNVRLFN